MAPVSYKAEVGVPLDSALPTDWIVVTPHFSDGGTPFNAQAVADKLRDLTKTYLGATTAQVRVRLYIDGAPKPNYPVATSITGTGFMASTFPRELALCLSFYETHNRPRQRGRLFMPIQWLNARAGIASLASRPTAPIRATALDYASEVLKPMETTVGAQWVVWSTVDRTMRGVTNYYVDDEWDVQRSRGMLPSTRDVGTVP